MKKHAIGLALAGVLVAGCGEDTQDQVKLETEMERVSYGFGVQLGLQLSEGLDPEMGIDAKSLAAGIHDAMADGELRMSEEEIAAAMQDFQHKQMIEQEQQTAQAAETNRRRSEEFLAENREREGVETLDSGLQYEVLEEGDGASPGPADTVKVHYRGTLVDGTEFDSSHQRGEPAQFRVDSVIDGWTEALQLMSEGDKWRLAIPAQLAYGPEGFGPIGPESALIFEVELLEVIPAD